MMGFRSGFRNGEDEWAIRDISFKAGVSKTGYEETPVMAQDRRSVERGRSESGDWAFLVVETWSRLI